MASDVVSQPLSDAAPVIAACDGPSRVLSSTAPLYRRFEDGEASTALSCTMPRTMARTSNRIAFVGLIVACALTGAGAQAPQQGLPSERPAQLTPATTG